MPEWVSASLVALAINLLAALIFEWLRAFLPIIPAPLPQTTVKVAAHKSTGVLRRNETKLDSLRPLDKSEMDFRVENRRKVKMFLVYVFFYFVTLTSLYLCLFLPPALKPLFGGEDFVSLQSARFIGGFLPNEIVMLPNVFSAPVLCVSIVLYLPALKLSTFILRPFLRAINAVHEMTFEQEMALSGLIFAFVALGISGYVIYSFYDIDFWWAVVAPFITLAVFMLVIFRKSIV